MTSPLAEDPSLPIQTFPDLLQRVLKLCKTATTTKKVLKVAQRVEKLCKCVQNVSQGGAGSSGSAVATGSAASCLAFARPAVDKM